MLLTMAKVIFMLLFIIDVLVLHVSIGHGRQFGGSKGILKTIKADDEMIDCVDIYKQPAFAHPLLVNHTIQLKPNFNTSRLGPQGGRVAVQQSWHKYGECPQGSIPIVRKQETTPFIETKASSLSSEFVSRQNHQYAAVRAEKAGRIHGAHATIGNWRPFVNPAGASFSQLWISAGDVDDLNTIEVGWRVIPGAGVNIPKIFVYWTNDNYKTTGCYNLECPGFVQTSKDVGIGSALASISLYGGVQYDFTYDIRKDQSTQNWWLTMNGIAIGYWPSKLFTRMSQNADVIIWGGEIGDIAAPNDHTPTQMGSGHFARESYRKASYIREIKYVNPSGSDVYLGFYELHPMVTQSSCYDLKIEKRAEIFVFYGGPGCRI